MPPRSQTILCLCEAHQISTVPLPHIAFKAFAYLALHDQAFASLRSSKSCPRYTQQSKPLPNFTLQHNAIATLCNTTPLPFDACPRHSLSCFSLAKLCGSTPIRCISLPLRAMPLLCCADHGRSRPRHCRSLLSFASPLLCRSEPRTATPLPVVARPSLAGRGFALAFIRALRR